MTNLGEPQQPEPQQPEPRRRKPQRAWQGRVAPFLVAIPYLGLLVFWIGFLATMESMSGLGWLAMMWLACLLFLPMAIIGGVWGYHAKSRATLIWGIVAAVLCLPGFFLSFYVVISMTGGWA